MREKFGVWTGPYIYGKTVILNWIELNQIVLKPCWYVVQLDRAMPAFKTCWINKASAPKVAQESGVRSKRNNGSVNSKRAHAPSSAGICQAFVILSVDPAVKNYSENLCPG